MKKTAYENMSNEKLLKTRNLLKGVSIGFGIIYILAITVLIYLITADGFTDISIATIIPIFVLPITFLPIMISLSLVRKEVKARNL